MARNWQSSPDHLSGQRADRQSPLHGWDNDSVMTVAVRALGHLAGEAYDLLEISGSVRGGSSEAHGDVGKTAMSARNVRAGDWRMR